MGNSESRSTKILFFLHLVQDLDLLEPLLDRAASMGIDAEAWITDRLAKYPRTRFTFEKLNKKPRVLPYWMCRFGFFPSVSGFDALLTGSESTAPPHRTAFLLARKASLQGLRTYTLQQGLDNIGLTHFDAVYTPEDTDFASQTIFLWNDPSRLDARVRSGVRARCVAAGCPKRARPAETCLRKPEWGRAVVSVFENLHRHSYGEADVRKFLNDFRETAGSFPEAHFILKPHPNRRWTAIHAKKELASLKNVTLADPVGPTWALWTSADLISVSDAVITTPSTVAFDAARAGCPAAVADMPGAGIRYEPLTLLKGADDWRRFIAVAVDPSKRETEREKARLFAARHEISGDAAERILKRIMVQ